MIFGLVSKPPFGMPGRPASVGGLGGDGRRRGAETDDAGDVRIGEDRLGDDVESLAVYRAGADDLAGNAGRLERRLHALGAFDGIGELRELDRQQAMITFFEPVLVDHPLADHVTRDDEVLTDESLAGIALGVFRIVDVLDDYDEAGITGLLYSRVERVRHGDRRQDGVLFVGDRGLDKVRRAGGVAIGVDVGEVDLEQARGLLRTELHRLEERRAGAAMLDEGHLHGGQVLRGRRLHHGHRKQGGRCERQPPNSRLLHVHVLPPKESGVCFFSPRCRNGWRYEPSLAATGTSQFPYLMVSYQGGLAPWLSTPRSVRRAFSTGWSTRHRPEGRIEFDPALRRRTNWQ